MANQVYNALRLTFESWSFINIAMKLIPLLVLSLLFAFQIHARAQTEKHLFPILQNGKWGYLDQNGCVAIKPQFQMAFDLSEGMAPVVLGNKFAR